MSKQVKIRNILLVSIAVLHGISIANGAGAASKGGFGDDDGHSGSTSDRGCTTSVSARTGGAGTSSSSFIESASGGATGGAGTTSASSFIEPGPRSSGTQPDLIATISAYYPKAEAARGKDITVFVGNTGAGKSTVLNILAGNDLVVGSRGVIALPAGGTGFPVGAGAASVTTYPQSFESTSLESMLWDMPGFQDSGGAVQDLLNAALMKAVIERAKTVKVALVVQKAEIEGIRTKGLKDVLKNIRMFPTEIRESSLKIVVTKVGSDELDDSGSIRGWLLEQISGGDSSDLMFFENLVGSDRIAFIPKPSRRITLEMIQGTYREQLEAHLKSISGQNASTLRMGMVLNEESGKVVRRYFSTIFSEKIKEMKTNWSTKDLASSVFVSQKEAYQEQLITSVLKSEGVNILQPLAEEQYEEVLASLISNPVGPFSLAFESAGLTLRLKEIEKERDEAIARNDEPIIVALTGAVTTTTRIINETNDKERRFWERWFEHLKDTATAIKNAFARIRRVPQ